MKTSFKMCQKSVIGAPIFFSNNSTSVEVSPYFDSSYIDRKSMVWQTYQYKFLENDQKYYFYDGLPVHTNTFR